jgi:hypothetical protein
MDEQRLRFYETVAHPSLSVVLPLFFVLLLDQLLRGAVLNGLVPNPPGTTVYLILTGVAEAAVANALGRTKSRHLVLRLRELLAVLVLGYATFMLTTGAVFVGEFVPRAPEVIYALALVFLLWILTVSLHATFRVREAFLATIVGHTGEELRTGVRDHSSEATDSTAAMGRAKRFVVAFQALVILLFTVTLLAGVEVATALIVMVLIHLVVGVSVLAVVDGYQEEQVYFGSGLPLGVGLRRRRLGSAGLLLAAGLLVAWPLAGADSIIPGGTLSDLMSRLAGWLTPQPINRIAAPEIGSSTIDQQAIQRPDRLDSIGGAARESSLAKFVQALLPWLGAAFGAILLVFLLRPLFSRDMRQRWRELRLRDAVRRIVGAIGRLLRSLGAVLLRLGQSPLAAVRRIARTVAVGVDTQRRAARARRTRAAEVARWREHAQIIKGFLRLIRTGERMGVRFRAAIGPLQYAGLLGERIPEQDAALREVGTLFEEMIFSGRKVQPEQTQDYEAKLRAVIEGLRAAPAHAAAQKELA